MNARAVLMLVALNLGPVLGQVARLPAGWDRTLARSGPEPAYLERANIFAAAEVPWQRLDAFTRRKVVFSRRATLVVLEVQRTGKGHDLDHWHHHDQITHVLDGEVEAVVGREARRIRAGGFYVCDSNVPHSLRMLSERVKLVEMFTPAREDFRGAPWVGAAAERSRAGEPLGPNEVRALVFGWFALFDRNAPVDAFLPHLAERGLEMRFPEATLASPADFRRWYAGIRSTIRSATHDVRAVQVTVAGAHAVVELDVRWQAVNVRGERLDFTVHQHWLVDRAPSGQPVIRSYRVILPGR